MKRILAVLTICLLLCGCTQQPPSNNADLLTSIPVVVPIGERTQEGVKVTIHEGLLGMDTEVLSEEQLAKGFLSGTRNEDGSVTYVIATDRYDAFVQECYDKTCNMLKQSIQDYASVTDIAFTDDFSEITLHVIRADYEYSVDALAVFTVGSVSIMYQAYDIDSCGRCVVKVFDENGEQLSENIYPDELMI